jgi:hypothetical protein
VFADPNALTTTASFTVPGRYAIDLVGSDGSVVSAADEVIVTVIGPQAPLTVDAGPDQTITLPPFAALSAAVQYHDTSARPSGERVTWSKVSGPGLVLFSSPHSRKTGALFSNVGAYTVRVTVVNGSLSASDDVVITVKLPHH